MRVLLCLLSTFLLSLLLCCASVSAIAVNVFYCNAYPANYVSISWGSGISSRIAYQSCASFTVDNTATSGTAQLWSSSAATTATFTNKISIAGIWCADSNRNIIVAYKLADGTLGITYLQQDGGLLQNCNSLPAANAVGYIINTACTLPQFTTVDIVASGTLLKASVNCGINYVSNIGAAAEFFSGPVTVSLNSHGTNTTLAGPFSVATLHNPQPDQSDVLIISGDQNNAVTLWNFTTTGAAAQSSAAVPTSAYHNLMILTGIVVAVLAAIL